MWEPLVKQLDERGIQHAEVDLPTVDQSREPTLSSHDDAAYLRAVLDRLDGPLVLVGNSYGGVVITEASADHPPVVHLAYLAAFMPDANEDVQDVLMGSCFPETLAGMQTASDGRIDLDPDVMRKAVLQQATPEMADWAVSKKRPWAMGQSGSPTVLGVGWRTIPSTYVVCGEDHLLKPEVQRQWAESRATDQIETPFDH